MLQLKAAKTAATELISQLKTNINSSAMSKMSATEIELLSTIYERIEAVRVRISGLGKVIPDSRTWANKLSSWDAKFDELELGEEIGEGAFGKVLRAVCVGVECAVKVIPTAITQGHAPANMGKATKSAKILVTETKALSHLHHPNVIRVIHLCCEPGNTCTLMCNICMISVICTCTFLYAMSGYTHVYQSNRFWLRLRLQRKRKTAMPT